MLSVRKHRTKIGLGLAVLVAVLVPVLLQNNDYVLRVVTVACIFAIATYGLNILLGYTGQLTLGHAGFFGIGAYTVGVLTVDYGVPFWSSLVCSVVLTSLVGYLAGIFALRTREEYFAIFTLAMGFVIYLVIDRWESVTGGANGLIGVPYPEAIGPVEFEGPVAMYYLVLAFLVLTIYLAATIARSLLGRTFMAIRRSEDLAASLGINVGRNKQLSFTISTGLAGLAGGLYATHSGFLGPEEFNIQATFEILMFLLVGGIGSLSGPLVGSLLVVTLFESFQAFETYRLVILGPVIIALVIFAPRGLAGIWRSISARFNARAGHDDSHDERSADKAEETR